MSRDVVEIPTTKLEPLFRSKKELDEILRDHRMNGLTVVQFYIPDKLYTPVRFYRDILNGEKVVSSS